MMTISARLQDELRDEGKGQKWADMLRKGTAPAELKETWDKLKGRRERTEFINNLFTKEEKGTKVFYLLAVENPVVLEL